MAWTAPRTWVTSEVVTAALMNAHVRDNLKAIGDAWTSYTPAWTATTTNPTIGNATRMGGYIQAGKLVIGTMSLTVGSTSTVGSGSYRWSLPVTAAASSGLALGGGWYDDASGVQYSATLRLISTTTFAAIQGQTGNFTAASPVVPATGDVYSFFFVYEAA